MPVKANELLQWSTLAIQVLTWSICRIRSLCFSGSLFFVAFGHHFSNHFEQFFFSRILLLSAHQLLLPPFFHEFLLLFALVFLVLHNLRDVT